MASSRNVLEGILPEVLAARDILERERELPVVPLVEPRRFPVLERAPEQPMDPDSLVASIILGEGTGDWKKDLALGLTGGAAGVLTEAAGGNSGVLDWIPGGGLLKALPAVPGIVSRIARRAAPEAANVAADVARRNELARQRLKGYHEYLEHMDPESQQKLKEEARKMGNMKKQVLIDAGETDLSKQHIAYASGYRNYLHSNISDMMRVDRESSRPFMIHESFVDIPEDVKQQIETLARRDARRAFYNTPGDYKAKRTAQQDAYNNTRLTELRKLYPNITMDFKDATSNNMMYAFSTFDLDTQKAIRDKALLEAAKAGEAGSKAYQSKYGATLTSQIRSEVKRRGYESVNDPALQQAERFFGLKRANNGDARKLLESVVPEADDAINYAPEKKAYTAPYSVAIEAPGGASRILTGQVPEEPVEEAAKVLINPLTGEVETEAERAARRQALRERAAATRTVVGGKRRAANEAVKKSQAKKKAAEAEAEKQAVIERNRATIAEIEAQKAERKAADEAEKAARTKWSVNTPGGAWDASRHQLGENGSPTGTTYRELLGEAGDTPENRRAAYVLDSLASVAARTIQPKGIDNPSMNWNDRRHIKTTYDDAMNRFYDDVEANRKTGNLPDVPGITYEPRKIRWGLDFKSRNVDEPLIVVDGRKESIYDALFRRKAYDKVNEILKGR